MKSSRFIQSWLQSANDLGCVGVPREKAVLDSWPNELEGLRQIGPELVVMQPNCRFEVLTVDIAWRN